MPDITGTLRPPRLPGAPPSPANGEMYFDTSASTLYWWDGTTWKSASGGSAAPEVFVGPNAPTRNQEVIWVDTDESPPAVTRDINMESWHTVSAAGEPNYQSPWVSAGFNLQFRKGTDGKVQMRGLIRGGAVNSVITQLPVGYRPSQTQRFSGMTFDGTSTGSAGGIQILDTGWVYYMGWGGQVVTAANAWLDMSLVEFDTDTVTQVASTVAQPMEPWHTVGAAGEPPMLNGWVQSAGADKLSYRKYPDGRVMLRGSISTGTNATAVFVLPAGYRPSSIVLMPVVGTNGAAGNYVQVDAAGNVVAVRAGTGLNIVMEWDTDTVTNFVAGSLPGPQRALSLPATPFDGQECYLVVDATNNVLWHMRYNQARVKWESVGGPPIFYLHEGTNAAYVSLANAEYITTSAAKTTRLGWTGFTPLVDCWVEATFVIGLVQKLDAAYHYGDPSIYITPTPVQGVSNPMIYHTQHSAVQTYEFYTISKIFALLGGTTYTIQCQWACNGGTWQYQQGPTTLWMTGKAWPR